MFLKKKKLFFVVLFMISVFVSAQQTPSVIPVPQNYKLNVGTFNFDADVSVYYDNDLLADEAHFLQKTIFEKKSLPVSIQKNKKNKSISLSLGQKKLVKGAYNLKIKNNNIDIEASTEEGIFNGIMSLMQLIEFSSSEVIPCWEISDAPRYDWRGIMLDESRHFFGKEKVKSLLNWMAFYKLNKFHWHLTDEPGWRLEIKKYPLLTLVGGIGNQSDSNVPAQFYTQDEIREIVQYAAERKIEIIPEIDMPGHAKAANRAYPEFSGGGSERYPNFTFNPGKEETYQYLTNILKETDMLFPSQMIHLGGDEVHFGNQQWNEIDGVKKMMSENKFTDLSQVEKYFMVRMADSLYAMGNKLLAWDEMADISLPVDKTIIFWWRHDKPYYLDKALNRNYQVVLCPRIPLYFDFVQIDAHKVGRKWDGAYSDLQGVYMFDVGKHTKNRTSQVLGIQANLWTEVVKTPQRFDFMLFPRISALSEAAWGTNSDYDDYQRRLREHLDLYKKSEIFYFNPFATEEYAEPVI